MKAFLLLLFLLAILGGITYYNLRPEKPEFPLIRNIVNADGKTLEVVLVGKEGDTIHFNRYSDKKRFSIPIESLSEADREFISQLPEQRPPRERVRVVKEEEELPPYIANRQKRIAEIKEKKSLLRQELKTGTLASSMEKAAIAEIKELDSEIKSLELAIQEYRANNSSSPES